MAYKTEAREIAYSNTEVLSIISGLPEKQFKANIGWILVRDADERYQFFLMPKSVFKRLYPGVDLIKMKTDAIV